MSSETLAQRFRRVHIEADSRAPFAAIAGGEVPPMLRYPRRWFWQRRP